MVINWYPGHMAKTRRLILENIKIVDVVVELVDARIPYSSRNPDVDEMTASRPKVMVLNKCDMADPAATEAWVAYYKSRGKTAVAVDAISGKGLGQFKAAVDLVMRDKYQKDAEKGMKKRPPKLMIVGIPNVGKSAFINKLAGRAGAKAEDKPGVTRTKQWIRVSGGFELLDTPGILWPRFDDEKTGLHLAFTGAIRDEVYDIVEAGCLLCAFFAQNHPELLQTRYKLDDLAGKQGHEILAEIGKRRGCLVSGGEVDTGRAARILFDEFRGCKLGKITLEMP